MKASLPWGGILPAFAMAVLVLFVFSTMQYYGPDSAVLRLHEAVANNDPEEFDQVVLKPVPAWAVARISGRIASWSEVGARIQVTDLDREPGIVSVRVNYRPPNSLPGTETYVARFTPNGWKVDLVQTLRFG